MRVLHVTRDYPPRSCGGISTAVLGLVQASADSGRGTSVDVVSFDAWRPNRRSALTGGGLSSQGAARIFRVRGPAQLDEACRFVDAAGPDVLHVHDGMLWGFAASCGPARRVFTPHVVHRALNALRGIDERTLSLQGQERALEEADVVVAPSRAAAAMLGRAAVVAPLGIAAPPPRVSSQGPPTVLHVGRFDAAKGTDDLMSIATRVLRARPGAVCEIAGGVPESAKSERRRRRGIEAGLPEELRDRVRLLGWLGPEALEAAYSRAWVLLQPSRLETVGLAVMEGMARGLPVVATRCGGPEELIDDGQTGVLVNVGDVEGAARATSRLLDENEVRAAMGDAAAEAARAWYWPRVVDRWLDSYGDQPNVPGTEQARIFDISL